MTAATSPAGAVPDPAPAGHDVPAAGPDSGEADSPAAGRHDHTLWVEIQPHGQGPLLALMCNAPPGAPCRYTGGHCRPADAINNAFRGTTGGVADRYAGTGTWPISCGMPVRVAHTAAGWVWDAAG